MIIFLLAWKPKFPLELSDPHNHPHTACPKETHYTSVGIGKSIHDSIRESHKGISAQITSSIQSENVVENSVSSISTQSDSKTSKTVRNEKSIESSLKVYTSLDYNHLITDEMRGILHPQNSLYYTLSCLDKHELHDAIYATIEVDYENFMDKSNSVIEAYHNDDIYTFAKQKQDMSLLKDQQVATLSILDSIARDKKYRHPYNSNVHELQTMSEDILKKTQISVSFDALFSEEQQRILSNTMTQMFQDSLLSIKIEPKCETTTHHIHISKSIDCSMGNMGYICKGTLPSTIVDCASQEESDFIITGFSGKSQTNKSESEQKVEQQIQGRKFEQEFYHALKSFVPIHELAK